MYICTLLVIDFNKKKKNFPIASVYKMKSRKYHTVRTILKYHTVRTIPKYHTVRTIPKYHTVRTSPKSRKTENTTLSEQF